MLRNRWQSACVALMGFGEPILRAEVEVIVGKLKNRNAAGKDEITGVIIKGGSDRVVEWIWRLCNIDFESGVVPENWRSTVIVPLYKVDEREINVRIIEVLAC